MFCFHFIRNHGQSQYGILSMQWITDIPVSNVPHTSTPRLHPRSESSTSQVTERSLDAYTVKSMGRNTSRLPRLAQKYSKTNVSRYVHRSPWFSMCRKLLILGFTVNVFYCKQLLFSVTLSLCFVCGNMAGDDCFLLVG